MPANMHIKRLFTTNKWLIDPVFLLLDVWQLVEIFADLNYGWDDSVPFTALWQHPVFQALMERSTQHQLIVS